MDCPGTARGTPPPWAIRMKRAAWVTAFAPPSRRRRARGRVPRAYHPGESDGKRFGCWDYPRAFARERGKMPRAGWAPRRRARGRIPTYWLAAPSVTTIAAGQVTTGSTSRTPATGCPSWDRTRRLLRSTPCPFPGFHATQVPAEVRLQHGDGDGLFHVQDSRMRPSGRVIAGHTSAGGAVETTRPRDARTASIPGSPRRRGATRGATELFADPSPEPLAVIRYARSGGLGAMSTSSGMSSSCGQGLRYTPCGV